MAKCPECGLDVASSTAGMYRCTCGAQFADDSFTAHLLPDSWEAGGDSGNDRTIQSDDFPDEAGELRHSDTFQLDQDALPAPPGDGMGAGAGGKTLALEDGDPSISQTLQSEDFETGGPGATFDTASVSHDGGASDPNNLATIQFSEESGETPLSSAPESAHRTIASESSDDPANSATINSDEFSLNPEAAGSESQTLASGSFDNPANSATLQSEDLPAPGDMRTLAETGNSGDEDDDELGTAQTFLSDDLSPDQVKTMQTVWKGAFPAGVKPNMTIKGAGEAAAASQNSLVIGQRKLATTAEAKGKQAELDYELIRVLGEGGMGVVYDARQRSVDRSVAVKMLKSKTAADARQRQKFLAEAVVTGDLDHPNIVPIYDVGSSERGMLFYAMKKVQGTPWMKVLPQKSLGENLEILMKVADAVAFAHSRGVVHRDLKPENVMLGDFGEVLVMDWGLALPAPGFSKNASITASHTMGGTPAYMSPEMASGPLDKITFQSDVYLLGAILYEILTGRPPHSGKNTIQCLYAAAKNEIRPTEKTGELVEIALRAMATNPQQRPATVRDFQALIRDYQAHAESISLAERATEDLARAGTTTDYRDYSRAMFGYEEALALWTGNARAAAGLTKTREDYARTALRKEDFDLGLSVLDHQEPAHAPILKELRSAQAERSARVKRLQTLTRLAVGMAAAFFVVVTGALFWISRERDRAVAAEHDARDAQKAEMLEREKADQARIAAEEAKKEAVVAKDQAVEAKDEAVAAQKEARAAEAVARTEEQNAQQAREDQEYEAYVAKIGLAAAQIRDNAFDTARAVLKACPEERRNWEWGRLWFLANRSWNVVRPETRLDAIAVSPDGKQFVTGGWNGQAQVWDATRGTLLHTLNHSGQYVHAVAYSPDGRLLATGGSDARSRIRLWNAVTGDPVQSFDGHSEAVLALAFSPDSSQLASGSFDNTVRLWNLDSEQSRVVGTHFGAVWSLAFSPDSETLASASHDGTVSLWPLASDALPAKFLGHVGPVYTVAFSPDGRRIASGGHDRRVLVWDPAQVPAFDYRKAAEGKYVEPPQFTIFAAHRGAVRAVAFNHTGRLLVSGAQDNTVCLWDVDRQARLRTLHGHGEWVRACTFAPSDAMIFSASFDGTARVWKIDEVDDLKVLGDRSLQGHSDAVLGVAFSRDGENVVTASRDRTARTWSAATGHELHLFEEGHQFLASNAVFQQDGSRLFTSAVDNSVRAWDVAAGTELARFDHTGRAAALAVSGDARWLLTGGDNPDAGPDRPGNDRPESDRWNAQVWDVARLVPGEPARRLNVLAGHRTEVTAVAIAPADDLACTCDAGGKVLLWNVADWTLRRRLAKHTGKITAAIFTADRQTLLTASLDKTVEQWNLADDTSSRNLALRHPDGVTGLSLVDSDRQALTACADGRVRLWNLADATLTWELPVEIPGGQVAIAAEGGRAITVDPREREVRLWDLEGRREIQLPTANGGVGPFLKLRDRGSQLWTALFSPNGRNILTIGGAEARLWDSQTAAPHITFSRNGVVASASFSPSGDQIVTASWDRSARVWDARTGKSLVKLGGTRNSSTTDLAENDAVVRGHTSSVNTAVYSPDGKTILTAGNDGLAILWNAETGELAGHLPRQKGALRSAVFSRDGTKVLTASSDKTARLWDRQSGALLQTFSGHDWGLTCAVFSPDGTQIATGSEDSTARVWDIATGRSTTLTGHTATVTSVVFLSDYDSSQLERGQRLLTGSLDGTAKLWDPATAKEILTLREHTQGVTSVGVSTAGRELVTGSRDGTAIVWLADDWTRPTTEPGAAAPMAAAKPGR